MASREPTSTFGVLNDPVSLIPEPIVEMPLSKEQLHERPDSNESHCNDYNNKKKTYPPGISVQPKHRNLLTLGQREGMLSVT